MEKAGPHRPVCVTDAPVLQSNGSVRAAFNVMNTSEDMIRELATLRGVLGVLLSETTGVAKIWKEHLEHAPQVVVSECKDAVVVTVNKTPRGNPDYE